MHQRVGDQVAEHLAEALGVAGDDRGDLGAGGDELHVAGRRGRVDGSGGELEQVDRLAFERALLVEPGQQQQVLDQQPHPGRLVLDPAHRPVDVGG